MKNFKLGIISLCVLCVVALMFIANATLFAMGAEFDMPSILEATETKSEEDIDVTVTIEKEVVVENVIKQELTDMSMTYIGDFHLTAYCPCEICCEQWAASPVNKTGSCEVGVYQGTTIAVDPDKIPYGSKVYIEGVGVRIATDCGGAIQGNRIDVYFSNHQDAWNFGTCGGVAKKVYIIND